MNKITLAAWLLAVAAAAPPAYQPAAYQPAPYKAAYKPAYDSYDEHPKYAYAYAVKDDYTYNDYAAQENRDGYNTDGSYKVLLPDGRVQSVNYYVNGDSGYVADVQYSGEPKYDNYKPAAYKAASSYSKPVYAPAPYAPEPAYAPVPAYPAAPKYKARKY